VLSARGCPFNCKFCTFSLNPLGQKRNYAARSVNSVVNEIQSLKAQIIILSDDDFFADTYTEEKFQLTPTYVTPKIDSNIYDESFDIDLDMIFEMAFGSLSTSSDAKIDMLIDEFIESLKG
jgi:radical SAM superfamily enzyme YgiQ (UPF0313 family)